MFGGLRVDGVRLVSSGTGRACRSSRSNLPPLTGRRPLMAAISLTLALLAGLFVFGPRDVAGATTTPAIIDNGTVQMGVHPEGHLNVPGGSASSGTDTTYVGLRYMPTNAESTAPGCLCEGWGVGDAISGVSGSANQDDGIFNISVVEFTSTATSARSVVDVGTTFRVTHDY